MKPSDMPHRLLESVRARHTALEESIQDTHDTYAVFHQAGHEPIVAAILTHCALTNEIIDGVNS